MLILLNGRFVSEEQAVVSVFDRGFLYGDGLFETMRVRNGKPFRWTQHLERLQRGAEFLRIKPPFTADALRAFAHELVARNRMPDSVLRLTLSRGIGLRGYSPRGAEQPVLVMALHPLTGAPGSDSARFEARAGLEGGARGASFAPGWRLVTSSFRLAANDPLARFKTCNKLPQILARAEADAAGADEALLLNASGFMAEASGSNVFWVEGRTVCTPPLESGILPGVTRAAVLEICRSLGLESREGNAAPDTLKSADGVFLSLSSRGVVEARLLDGVALKQSPMTGQIRTAYEGLLRAETE
jgi:branched-subunit amino acid aminotransferase/4-amino-4-deoxychorismate lyase